MQLRLDGLEKRFGDTSVLRGITADFPNHRALVLIGPSGGGKSTLLRIIAGLEKPNSGSVFINAEPIDYEDENYLRKYRRRIGVVFQAFNLFPHFTAVENVALPLVHVHGQAEDVARSNALAALERFGLADHAAKKPAQLSGGQKQRVAIARALASNPAVLFFDEPTSALDPEMTAEVLEAIEELKREGRHFVLVTHEMGFARQVADHVIFLADGQIGETGPPGTLFAEPTTVHCRSFLARVLKY